MQMPDVHILSVGTMLPGPPLDTAMLARRFGMTGAWEQWVNTFVGPSTRHLSVDLDTGQVTHSLADLIEQAAARALAAAGTDTKAVDVVVMGTSTPDSLMPATVNMVADRLGIDGIPTYQLQSGCSGAVQALDVARQLLVTGCYRTALVLGGDSITKHADFSTDPGTLAPAQLVSAIMFGDGAGAAVLSTGQDAGDVLLRDAFVRLAGLNRPPGHTVEWFGLRDRHADLPAGGEDYKAIEESVPVMAEEILQCLLDRLDWCAEDVDYLLPPQLSIRMTARIVERLGLPDAHEISCIARTSNTGNALPFFQLEQLLPLLRDGDLALGIAVESSKWIKAGYAIEKC